MVNVCSVWQDSAPPHPRGRRRVDMPGASGDVLVPAPPPRRPVDPAMASDHRVHASARHTSILDRDRHTVNVCWPALHPRHKFTRDPAGHGRCTALIDLAVRSAARAHGCAVPPMFNDLHFKSAEPQTFPVLPPPFAVVTPRVVRIALGNGEASDGSRGGNPGGSARRAVSARSDDRLPDARGSTASSQRQRPSEKDERASPLSPSPPRGDGATPVDSFNETISAADAWCPAGDDAWSGAGTPRQTAGLSRLPHRFDRSLAASERRTRALTRQLPTFAHARSVYGRHSQQAVMDGRQIAAAQRAFEEEMSGVVATARALAQFEVRHVPVVAGP